MKPKLVCQCPKNKFVLCVFLRSFELSESEDETQETSQN